MSTAQEPPSKIDWDAVRNRAAANKADSRVALADGRPDPEITLRRLAWDAADIPAGYRDATWEGIQPERWRAALWSYCEGLHENVQKGLGVFVATNFGLGKSRLFAILAQEAFRHRVRCLYVASGAVLADRLDRYARKPDREDDVFGLYLSLPLVLLDDLPYAEAAHGYNAPLRVAEWLRFRYAEGRAVAIGSNVPWAELQARPEWAAVMDRLEERIPLRWRLEAKGQSRRKAQN